MFISVSAVALDRYEWFKYKSSRKTLLDNHNKHHDLALERNDVFGVRKYGKTYNLIDITAPRVLFKVTEEELKKIYKNAVGFSPSVKGKRLPKGKTGVARRPSKVETLHKKPKKKIVVKKEERTHIHKDDVPDSLYPVVQMPPNKNEIRRLYTHFNKKYFDNRCPDLKFVRVMISPAIRFMGQAGISFKSGEAAYTLKMAKKGFTDYKRIIDILLHEMIHLDHFKKAYEGGEREYVNAGHGPLFLRDMQQFNNMGFKLSVVDDGMPPKATLSETVYVLMFELDTIDQWLFVYSDKAFKGSLQDILNQLRSRFSYLGYKRYIYGKTKCSHAYLGSALTRDNQLHKRVKGFRPFKVEDSDGIFKELLAETKIIEEKSLKQSFGEKDIRDTIAIAVDKADNLMSMSWLDYLRRVVDESKNFYNYYAKKPITEALEVISQDEQEYIRQHWLDVRDVHFTDNINNKELEKGILLNDLDGEEAIKFLMSWYNERFKDRVTPDRGALLINQIYGKVLTDTDRDITKWVKLHFGK